jgi:recombination protein RecA
VRRREPLTREEEQPVEPQEGQGEYGEESLFDASGFMPTGCSLLNLALSDNPYGGYVKGSVLNLVGDRSAGKTFLLWTLFAELIKMGLPHRLVYDEPEAALQFALEKLFGTNISLVELEIRSETIQDFFRNVMGVIKHGGPFVYGLDSFDSLTSDEEIERADVGKGGWKTEKAIASGEILRQIVRSVHSTESLVAVVSQTRANIGVTFGSKTTRSGGKALGFYCTHEIWLRVIEPIYRKKREVGVSVEAKIKKNKMTGKLRTVQFDILYDYGVDDVGSMIDWLIKEKFWSVPKGKQIIDTQGDFPNSTKPKLVSHIEDNNLEKDLIKVTADCWKEIEDEIKTDRKPRYL